jgi:hypothetical protein
VAGCGDSPVDVIDPPEPLDLSGVWDFTEVLLRSTQPVVCSDTGSYWLLNDSVVEFVVSGGCGVWEGNPIDARYFGTVSRGPPLRMSGSSACSVNLNG